MEQVIELKGARVALNAQCAEPVDLAIRHGRILPFRGGFGSRNESRTRYDLSGHLILPGLINAHDHLEFNLFPRLGRGPYSNASCWAADIYRPEMSPVKDHLRVPKRARLIWGGIKNLLSGVTTVVHHNPFEPGVFGRNFPIGVLRKCGWAHSLEFSPDILERYRRTPISWPFIVHAAEGADEGTRAEVPRLNRLGILSRRTMLVHAVAAGSPEIETIRGRGVSIAWCPSSNLYTLGRTLDVDALRSGVLIALGTDSAMTAEGDLIDEMRVAREAARLTAEEIYALVTTNAARALRLSGGQGTIREGGVADLIVVEDRGQTPAEALARLDPELVIVGGRIMLTSQRLVRRFAGLANGGFSEIGVEGRGRWLVRAKIAALASATAAAIGPEIRLAGRRVCF